jgi:TAP-like protein
MTTRYRPRWLAGLGLALCLMLGATPGSQAQVQVPVPPRSPAGTGATYAAAPCPSPNVPGVPQLELGPEFSCGYLTVPENRARPEGRQIRIPVARARSASAEPQPDPLLYLAGGPGGTGLATAVLRLQQGWTRDRDVLFVDQRGTLHADPLLSCPEIDAVTPPGWAEVAARGLSHGRVVRVPGVGHDVTLWSECGTAVMLGFLDQPAGGYDTSRLDTLTVPPFSTGG